VRLVPPAEKEVIGEAIPRLEGVVLERAIDIIKKDTNQNVSKLFPCNVVSVCSSSPSILHCCVLTCLLQENDSGELELDIEALSQEALTKLYDMSIKQFPNMREEKERSMMALAPPPPEPVAKPKPKPKKNKPMGKAEQEARLRQLSDLKAALKGRGSNSQEPIDSVEGNGGATPAGDQTTGAAFDSDEEESSEEE
jgi:bromodomain-containing factor 1